MRQYFQKISSRPHFREIIVLVVFTLALTVPFISQAFHWDDIDFVEAAKVSARNPTQYHLEDYSYRGLHRQEYPIRHPPLLSTYLGLVIRLAGKVSETFFHLAYLIFPLIAVISMYALGRRFTGQPLVASLLLLFSAGFLVMSHTIMGNLPGTAFWLAATASFVWGVDRSSLKLLLASGVLMAAAMMTFAQGVSLFPLLVFYALLKWRLFRWKTVTAFMLPLAAFLGWRYFIQSRYGFAPAISYQVDSRLDWQIGGITVFIGSTIVFPLSYYVLFLRKKVDVLVAFLFVPPLVTWTAMYLISKGEITTFQGIFIAFLATAGFLVAYKMIANVVRDFMRWVRKRRYDTDSLFLLAWFAGVLAVYFVTSLPFVAVRHLLPLFPPVILMFVRESEEFLPMQLKPRRIFVITTLVLTLAVGLSAAIADNRLANSYRDLAGGMGAQYADNGTKVWELGEFGFRYYMEQAGFEYLGVDSVAEPGDLVVVSYISSKGVVAPLPEGAYTVVSRIETESAFPVRTMNPWAGAGFYGNLMGPIPIVPSTDKLDEITVNMLYWETE
ncbi:MAG TPA: hypothetical protein ENH44_03610 [Actinobacteria bacterium]|nr:hypothetical protein [Actinomycetota bacterium]